MNMIKKINILTIETTGKEASVALINEKELITSESSKQELNHLRNLIPLIDNLLQKCGLPISDVTHIAASEGPGSFTGIRIGITSARALAQTLGIKTIGVPTLKMFHGGDENTLICPIFDARRNQVYASAYLNSWKPGEEKDAKNRCTKEMIIDGAYDLDDYLKNVSEKLNAQFQMVSSILFFGDGIDKYKEKIENWFYEDVDFCKNKDRILIFSEGEEKLQNAKNAAKLAFELLKCGQEKDYGKLLPVYLRKAEAEIKLEQNK